eukprot:4202545-Ditylum_brightwellii.AAC.1
MSRICKNMPSLSVAFLPHFSQMEGNCTAMASSTPALSAVTISSSSSDVFTAYNIVLDMMDE